MEDRGAEGAGEEGEARSSTAYILPPPSLVKFPRGSGARRTSEETAKVGSEAPEDGTSEAVA